MNERIEKLIEQCTVQNFSDCTGGFETFDKEKFFELILMDVMSICEELGDKGQDGHYCVDAIRRKYFGVE